MLYTLLMIFAVNATDLTLYEALESADKHNLNLQSSRYELEAADARVAQAWANLIPKVSAGVTYSHADHADEVDMMAGMVSLFEDMGLPVEVESEPMIIRQQDSASASLKASVPLVSFQAWSAIKLYKSSEALTKANIDEARQQILLATSQAWYMTSMSASLVELQKLQIESAKEHVDAAKARLDAGIGLRIDVVRANADLLSAQREYDVAVQALGNSKDGLSLLTGIDDPIPTITVVPKIPNEGFISNRGDVLVAEAQLELAKKQLRLVQASYGPTLAGFWQGDYQITETTDFGSDDPSRWTVGLSMDIPLLDHKRFYSVKEAKASVTKAEINVKAVQEKAKIEISEYFRDLDSSKSAYEISLAKRDLAREAMTLVEASYQEGTGSSLEISDARRQASSAEIGALTSELQLRITELALLKCLGQDLLISLENNL